MIILTEEEYNRGVHRDVIWMADLVGVINDEGDEIRIVKDRKRAKRAIIKKEEYPEYFL